MTAAKTTRRTRKTQDVVPRSGPFGMGTPALALVERANDPVLTAVPVLVDGIDFDRAFAEIENRWREAVHDPASYGPVFLPAPVTDAASSVIWAPDADLDARVAALMAHWDDDDPMNVPGPVKDASPPASSTEDPPTGAAGPGTQDDDPAQD